MRSSRLALGALIVCALIVPITALAYDQVRPPLDRRAEYKQASDVVEGQVKSLQRLDSEGKSASTGPRFRLDLAVLVVHKSKEKGKPSKGDTLSVRGWAEGKEKQTWVPKEKDEVLAFLKRHKDGTYEPIRPTGFEARASGRSLSGSLGRPPDSAPPPKKSKEKK
jgi:hypothetical protein